MGTKSYAKTVSDIQVMIQGAKENEEILSLRGINEEFIRALEEEVAQCIQLNNEQEALKAKQKAKTQELKNTLLAAIRKSRNIRKIVKMDIPQALWREFGIEDKR